MVMTKQTACGRNSSRLAGMSAVTFGDETEEGQFEEVPEEEDEATWLDLDAPCKGEEVGDGSKSMGKKGDQPNTQAIETPAQGEGVATAPPAANPNTAVTVPPQDPLTIHRTPPTNPRILKQALAQMTHVSRNM